MTNGYEYASSLRMPQPQSGICPPTLSCGNQPLCRLASVLEDLPNVEDSQPWCVISIENIARTFMDPSFWISHIVSPLIGWRYCKIGSSHFKLYKVTYQTCHPYRQLELVANNEWYPIHLSVIGCSIFKFLLTTLLHYEHARPLWNAINKVLKSC